MPTTDATPNLETLWLTDRSRVKAGLSRCPRQRYLSYHAGPTGYGLTARRESLPLTTGASVHEAFAQISGVLLQHKRLPDLAETRAIINATTAAYLARVDERGYRGILGGAATTETIEEQCALIGGLVWTARLKFFPWLDQHYEVIEVEQERLHRLAHDVAIMQRTDLIAKRRGGQTLAYFEFKTTGWASEAWTEQWETDPQLALGTVDALARWGAEVTELYIIVLNKGARQRDRYDADGDQRKKQMSPLCYGYCRPANPPLQPEDWLPAHEWVDDQGVVKRASRAHKRTGVWKLSGSDWPVWQAYLAANPGMSPVEFWVRMLPPSQIDKVCTILGPMNRQDRQLEGLLRGILGEEQRWREQLWALYDRQTQGATWRDEAFQAELDRLVPCSWACRPFGKEHQCEFVPICHRHQGWDDPIGSGQYQPRLPHHEPERQQAIGRGLLPEQASTPEEE